ncbi:MAG: DUF819 family protein [Bacteroidota bacterium]
MVVLALIFWTSKSEHPFWQKFYKFVPILLLAYFIPAILRSFGLIAPEWLDADGVVVKSQLYFVASRYLLPACLILLCLSIDIKGIIGLGPKAIVMFLAASLGIILGGPVALLVVTQLFPNLIPIPADQLWTGFSTIAGSWIGGGANQTAMKEIFDVADDLFGMMIIVDILVANIWLGFLLYGINVSDRIDRFLKADNSAIERLKKSVSDYRSSIEQMPTVTNTLVLMGVAFGGTALAHWAADSITPWMSARSELLENLRLNSLTSGFFWLIVVATTVGFGLSFTKAKRLEGVGASRWGTIFIYILVATIGMKMDLSEIFERKNAGLLLIGVIWMMIHVLTLFIVAYIIRAPYFFIAVGSQANVGGAASAPVVAAAFDSALAPVGVLMAVLGYALGTYGALICALMMQGVVS